MIEIALEVAYACMSTKSFLWNNLIFKKIETLFLEINLLLGKWLIGDAYKPPDQSKSVFSERLPESLSIYLDP